MTSFTTQCARLFAAAALTLLLTLALSPAAHAQRCACDQINVTVDASVACTIELHMAAPLCRFAPVFVNPGTSVQIPCCNDMMVTIVACDHSDPTFTFGVVPTCFTRIPIQPGCCVDACTTTDPNGCPQIVIRRSLVKCPLC
jgi:hypothetical protein